VPREERFRDGIKPLASQGKALKIVGKTLMEDEELKLAGECSE
jgi:hypothetical protein